MCVIPLVLLLVAPAPAQPKVDAMPTPAGTLEAEGVVAGAVEHDITDGEADTTNGIFLLTTTLGVYVTDHLLIAAGPSYSMTIGQSFQSHDVGGQLILRYLFGGRRVRPYLDISGTVGGTWTRVEVERDLGGRIDTSWRDEVSGGVGAGGGVYVPLGRTASIRLGLAVRATWVGGDTVQLQFPFGTLGVNARFGKRLRQAL